MMTSSDLAVWMTRTDTACEAPLLARYVALLSDAERGRWAAYRSESARTDFLVGRALVRCALSHVTAEPPQHWRFTTNAFGRPEIDAAQNLHDLRFNLSHTRGLIACVVAIGRDVGIDVECIERPTPVVELARRFLGSSATDELLRAAPDARQARFFELWTLEESRVKALGTGLGGGDEHDHARWRSWLLHPTPSHVLAVTAEIDGDRGIDLRTHHTVPLAA